MNKQNVARSDDSGQLLVDVLSIFAQAQRSLAPAQAERVLTSPRAVNHSDDDIRQAQAEAAATNLLRKHIADLTCCGTDYDDMRAAFLLALKTYRQMGGTR